MTGESHRNSLKSGYSIGPYEIIDILGQGGFGITYLAMDINLQRKVAVKEYLPVELAVRDTDTSVYPVSAEHSEQFNWGLERFISEAQTLARFRHPNIVRVLTVLKQNNTAYIVMEYESGYPFSDMLKGKKTLEEKELKNILFPIMDGLESVHKTGFIHRDIKPPNIYIREDNSPVLIDFGSARQSLHAYTRTLTTLVSPGFAPFEQYVGKSGRQGPWTDIYGLGATLYRAVTGLSPADAMERSEALLHTGRDIYVTATEIAGGKYSPAFLAAIDRAMAFKVEDRPQSIAEWRNIFTDLNPAGPTPHAESEAPTIETDIKTEKVNIPEKPGFLNNLIDKLNRIIWKSVGWGLVLIVIFFIVRILLPGNRQSTDQTRPVQTQITETAPQTTDDASRGNIPPVTDEPVHANTESVGAVPQSTNESSGNLPQVMDEPEREETATTSDIPKVERQKLQSIRNRLRENPRDRQARLELGELANRFEQNIVQAVNRGEYELAKAYLYEIQKNADKTSPAYKRLEELLALINKMEKQGNK